MVNLIDRIRKDLIKSVKNREKIETSVLRMLIAELQNRERSKRYTHSKNGISGDKLELASALTQQEVEAIIALELKKRRESIREFKKGGREDLAKKEKEEQLLLSKYLPEQISTEELSNIIETAIASIDKKDRNIGNVMPKIMPLIKGRADGSEARKIVNKILLL